MTPPLTMPIIGALSACLCGLLSVFLLLAKGPLRAPNRLLAGFLFLAGIDMAGWMAPLAPPAWRDFLPFRLPLAFLQMPLLYAYMVQLCFPGARSWWNRAAAALAPSASVASLLPRAAATIGLSAPRIATSADLVFNDVALHLQFYLYAALMLRLLLRYRRARRDAAGGAPSPVESWIGIMLAVSVGAHTLVVLKSWAWIGSRHQAYTSLDLVVGLVAAGVCAGLTLTAMLRQPLFVGMALPPRAPRRPRADRDPAASRALSELDRYMIEQQLFLDPALTIRALARRIGMGQRELSVLLNQTLGVHFFDYVNRHRVDKAAELLADAAHRSATILEIAHLAGFNTKSSFNAAFAKHRGETPSQYRARMRAPPSSDP